MMPTIKIETQHAPNLELRQLSETRYLLLQSRDALGREQAGLIARSRGLAEEIKTLGGLEKSLFLRETAFAVKHERMLELSQSVRANEAGLLEEARAAEASASALQLAIPFVAAPLGPAMRVAAGRRHAEARGLRVRAQRMGRQSHGVLGLARQLAGKAAGAKAAKLTHRGRRMALQIKLKQAMRQLKTVQAELGRILAQMSANRRARLLITPRIDLGGPRNGAASAQLQMAGLGVGRSGKNARLERAPAVRLQNLVGALTDIA